MSLFNFYQRFYHKEIMQANLKINTFNNHNRIPKNDYINKRQDPMVNRISNDLTYKTRSITNVNRNPVHINGGQEYLHNKRVEELKRKLRNHQITPEEYNAELARVQTAWFGHPVDNEDVYRHKKRLARYLSSAIEAEKEKVLAEKN